MIPTNRNPILVHALSKTLFSGIRFVNVDTDGGTGGSSSTPPSFTYTVSDYFTDEELGTELEPMWARTNGSHSAGTIGFAIKIDGDWALIVCDEVLIRVEHECET